MWAFSVLILDFFFSFLCWNIYKIFVLKLLQDFYFSLSYTNSCETYRIKFRCRGIDIFLEPVCCLESHTFCCLMENETLYSEFKTMRYQSTLHDVLKLKDFHWLYTVLSFNLKICCSLSELFPLLYSHDLIKIYIVSWFFKWNNSVFIRYSCYKLRKLNLCILDFQWLLLSH